MKECGRTFELSPALFQSAVSAAFTPRVFDPGLDSWRLSASFESEILFENRPTR
jgi:hypothetical protein